MDNRRPIVSVVVPAHNETDNVGPFHAALDRASAGKNYDVELLFVDDGSTDDTFERLSALADTDDRIRVLRLSRNFGSLQALNAGLQHATGDAVMIISADLQDPPELINDLLEKWREGVDIVWAVREQRDDPFFKRLWAGLFYWLVRRLVFPDFPPGGMDCGLFDRRIVEIYRSLPERHSSPLYTIYALGFRQAFVPYARQQRVSGHSKWSFARRVKTAVDFFTTFSYAPVRLISAAGILIAFLAFLMACFYVARKLLFGYGGEGWTSIVVLILAVGGVQMLMLGVLAEYLWRISEQVRHRPRYIVMQDYPGRHGRQADGPDIDIDNIYVADRARPQSGTVGAPEAGSAAREGPGGATG